MKNEIKQLECLLQISSAIIATPLYSLSSFGIMNDPRTKKLIYTGKIDSLAKANYATVAAAAHSLSGAAAIVTTSALKSFGLIAGAGVLAAAGGASATGVGLAVAPFILLWGYKKYKQKKREEEQKERMYQELIAKQQAAINRQKEINRELEERLRKQSEIYQERSNLKELIDVLTEQINKF